MFCGEVSLSAQDTNKMVVREYLLYQVPGKTMPYSPGALKRTDRCARICLTTRHATCKGGGHLCPCRIEVATKCKNDLCGVYFLFFATFSYRFPIFLTHSWPDAPKPLRFKRNLPDTAEGTEKASFPLSAVGATGPQVIKPAKCNADNVFESLPCTLSVSLVHFHWF